MRSLVRGAREGLRRLVFFALAEGWQVSRTRGGHLRFSKQGCASIFTSGTPSDHRSTRNAHARLRRACPIPRCPQSPPPNSPR